MSDLNFDEITSTFIKTVGFSGLDDTTQDEIMKKALEKITQQTDFIVFIPLSEDFKNELLEDEGRTLKIPLDGEKLKEKVYVKLDDYKTNEKENFGKRFCITFMLAEEY